MKNSNTAQLKRPRALLRATPVATAVATVLLCGS